MKPIKYKERLQKLREKARELHRRVDKRHSSFRIDAQVGLLSQILVFEKFKLRKVVFCEILLKIGKKKKKQTLWIMFESPKKKGCVFKFHYSSTI